MNYTKLSSTKYINLLFVWLISCTTPTNSNIDQLYLTYSVQHVSVENQSDGSIDLTVRGGKSPYTFTWSNGKFNEDIYDLRPGDYSVVVTDALGEISDTTITVLKLEELRISLIGTDVSFTGGADGSVELIVDSGMGPFKYEWSNGDTSKNAYNLSTGLVAVVVRNYHQQSAIDSIFISQPVPTTFDTTIVSKNIMLVKERGISGNIDVNIGVLWNSSGTLLIDSGYRHWTNDLQLFIYQVTHNNITHICNTHTHGEHIEGNSILDGGSIVGHVNGTHEIRNSNTRANFIGLSELSEYNIHGEVILCDPMELNGHSSSDVIYFFKKSNILFLGDLYFSESFPYVFTPHSTKVQNAIAIYEDILSNYTDVKFIIPNHGKIATLNEFKDWVSMVKETVDIVQNEMVLGNDLDTIINKNVLRDYQSWGQTIPIITTDFWIESIYWSYYTEYFHKVNHGY